MARAYYRLDARQVVPCSEAEWERIYKNLNPPLARAIIGKVQVSTVFLGVSLGHGNGPPKCFETMVFEWPLIKEQTRWSTYAEALAGHAEIVDRVKSMTFAYTEKRVHDESAA